MLPLFFLVGTGWNHRTTAPWAFRFSGMQGG